MGYSDLNHSDTKQGIGASVKRNEDARLVNGQGTYLADLEIPGTLEAAFIRSPVAHARLGAVKVPSEYNNHVFLAADLDFAHPIVAATDDPQFQSTKQFALAKNKVRYVGEMIAVCIAPTRAQAEDIAQSCELELDELPALWDMDVATSPDALLIHEHWRDNIYLKTDVSVGDFQRARKEATVSLSKSLSMGRHGAVPLECRGVLAHHDRRLNELTVYSSTQFPHVLRTCISRALDLPESQVRVIAPDVGGGFGAKGNFSPEELTIAALAMKLNQPIRWIEDRRENLIASPHAREHRYDVTVHANNDGLILGIEALIRVDAGAYSVWPWTAAMEAGMVVGILPGPYHVPAYAAKSQSICTNKTPMGPYRGVGRTGACFAMDVMIDALARELHLDPADVRLLNLIKPEDMPYQSITGKQYDSGDYPEAARKALDAIDVGAIRSRQATGEKDNRLIGFGMSSYTEQTAHGTAEWVSRGLPVVFGYEPALARLTPDGKLILHVGIQNHGQGLETTLAQVASEELGIAVADVVVRHGDSSVSPYGMGTFGSRSMTMAGGAVSVACGQLADKVKRIGAHLLQSTADAVTLSDGRVHTETASVPLAEVAEAATLHPERLPEGEEPGLDISAVYEPKRSTGAFSYATHACVMAVDPGTGEMEILDYVVVHDCGRMVNPMIVEAQVVGGVAQGLGTALYEEIPYDDNGQPLSSTFLDYMIPGCAEVPNVRMLHIETPSPHTQYGIKGLGEGGAISPPAAVVNALNDALKSLGAEITQTPVTPLRILEAIESGTASSL